MILRVGGGLQARAGPARGGSDFFWPAAGKNFFGVYQMFLPAAGAENF